MENDKSGVARLREAILHYLQQNPNAADTVEGIMRWWLKDKQNDAAKIEQALEQLVAEGLVETTSLVDGTTLYMRGARRAGE